MGQSSATLGGSLLIQFDGVGLDRLEVTLEKASGDSFAGAWVQETSGIVV
jgi:hypothetical protein